MKGIDISNYNNVSSFQAIKNAGYEIVGLKATEGLTFNDGKMMDFYRRAKAAGLKTFFYHMLHQNNAIEEAKHFLNQISGLESDCLYMLDVENTSGCNLEESPWDTSQRIVDFCEYLKSQGKQPGIYVNLDFWNNVIKGNARNYPVWIARYGSSAGINNYAGWQYSENGSVPGVSGECDMNIFTDSMLLNKSSVNTISSNQTISDNSISKLQQILNSLINAGLNIDGDNGPLTQAAIKRFQTIMGLYVDGDPGPKTWAAINEILAKPTDGIEYQHYEYATRWIQWRVGARIDGVFGGGTADKVKDFQQYINNSHGESLSVDGIVGKETWRCMFKY